MNRKKIMHCFVITTIFGMLLGAKTERFLYDPVITDDQQKEGYAVKEISPYRPDSDTFIKGVAARTGDLEFNCCVKSTEIQGVLAVGLRFSNLSASEKMRLPESPVVRVMDAASASCKEMTGDDILQVLEEEKKEHERKDQESEGSGLFNPLVRDNYYNRLKKEANLMVGRRYDPKELTPGETYEGDIYYRVDPDQKVTVTVDLNGKEPSFIFEKKVPGKEKRPEQDRPDKKVAGDENEQEQGGSGNREPGTEISQKQDRPEKKVTEADINQEQDEKERRRLIRERRSGR